MHRCKLKDAPDGLIAILIRVAAYEANEMPRYRNKATFDIFDFPGTSPHAFDLLKDKYEALTGNHRNGFNVSPLGLKYLAKPRAPKTAWETWACP